MLAGGLAVAAKIDWPEPQAPALPKLAEIDAGALKRRLDGGGVALLDLRSSADYRASHIGQAKWTIRPLIARAPLDAAQDVVLISDQLQLASLAAIDLGDAGVSDISFHHGGTDDWAKAGLEIAQTPDLPADSAAIDFVFFTHGRHDGNADASRQYLAWELGLTGQLDDDERAVFNIARSRV